jgi:hypothetical protein
MSTDALAELLGLNAAQRAALRSVPEDALAELLGQPSPHRFSHGTVTLHALGASQVATGDPDEDAAIMALEAHTNSLLTGAERASEAATERGDEIDAVLTNIREVRALTVAASAG